MATQAQKTYELMKKLSDNQSKFQLDISSEISVIKNGVSKIEGYLYTDKSINKKGAIERLDDVEDSLDDIKESVYELKGYKRMAVGIGTFVIFIGGVFWGLFKFFK